MSFHFIHDIEEILVRDLLAMKEEVLKTPQENLWQSEDGVINSVGTLAYHLCGNLRHFIGAVLGKDGYIRDRESEFSHRGFPREELVKHIEETVSAVRKGLSVLTLSELDRPMPDTPPQHTGRTVGFFLIQLICHLSRHRGQLDYLRRIKAAKSGN